MRRPSFLPGLCAALAAAFLCAAVSAAEPAPLHDRIDQFVDAGMTPFKAQPAALASDAEFLRHVSLDLTGTIPTAAEARSFLQDSTPDKRAKLIDLLLARPD